MSDDEADDAGAGEGDAIKLDEDNPATLAVLRAGVDLLSLHEEAKTYTFVVPPWEVLGCAAVPGDSFAFDSSFLRPAGAAALADVATAVSALTPGKALVFGHTDPTDGESAEKELSERRARCVHAALTGDVDVWVALNGEESWGLDVVQLLLADLGHPPGPIDGEDGPKTKGAVKAFQTEKGLGVDGIAGPITRKALFTAYLDKYGKQLAADAFMDEGAMGCAAFNPVAENDGRYEPNRRAMVYVFKAPRLPVLPCALGDTGPCQGEIGKGSEGGSFTCQFYSQIAQGCGCERPAPMPPSAPTAKKAADDGAAFVEDCLLVHPVEG